MFDDITLPSCFNVQDTSYDNPGPQVSMTDNGLHFGEIVAMFPPNHMANISKKETEYVVMVQLRDSIGILTPTPYRCVRVDGLGGVSDHLRMTVRPSSGEIKERSITDGSMVLIACINGDKNNGVILGGIRHPDNKTVDVSDARYLSFMFNGVAVNIADDGGLKITIAGATKNDGTPDNRSENNKESFVEVKANGNVCLSDNHGQTITINPEEKMIFLECDKEEHNVDTSWKVKTSTATIIADKIYLGGEHLQSMTEGVVVASGVDTFTGSTYGILGSASGKVMAKK
jgi:hypothetical protein